jgi:hypothetical protein
MLADYGRSEPSAPARATQKAAGVKPQPLLVNEIGFGESLGLSCPT